MRWDALYGCMLGNQGLPQNTLHATCTYPLQSAYTYHIPYPPHLIHTHTWVQCIQHMHTHAHTSAYTQVKLEDTFYIYHTHTHHHTSYAYHITYIIHLPCTATYTCHSHIVYIPHKMFYICMQIHMPHTTHHPHLRDYSSH